MSKNDRDVALAQALKFSEADLRLNQLGEIADGQKQVLASSRNTRMISIIAYVVMLSVVLLVCIGVGVSLLINGNGSTTRVAVMSAMAVAMLFIGAGAANYFLRSRDVLTGKISQMEGAAKLYTRQYHREVGFGFTDLGTGWFVKLGSKEFRLLTTEQYAAFEEGVVYRLYYIKTYPIDTILSVEAL